MNRRHTVNTYRKLIETALRKIPDLGIGTDLMVGFPGETETAFQNTVAVASDLPFSYLRLSLFVTAGNRGTAHQTAGPARIDQETR